MRAALILCSRACIPLWFLVVALPVGMLLTLLTPPFQNPDEIAHVLRADQVARGVWRGERVACAAAPDPVLCHVSDEVAFHVQPGEPAIGGAVDPALLRLAAIYRGIPFRPERTVTRAMDEAAGKLVLGQPPHPAAFTNTAVYSPLLYLPAAAAIGAARLGGMGPVAALQLARVVNLLATLCVAGAALVLCRRGARSMAVLLLLPMSLAMAASVAPDGIMFAAAALGGAILSRGMQRECGRPGLSWSGLALLAAVLLVISLPRPPYAALGLLVLAAPLSTPLGAAGCWRSLLLRLAVSFPAILAVAAWVAAVSPVMLPIPVVHGGGRPDIAGQIAYLLADPARLVSVVRQTVAAQAYTLGYQAIGRLGWLDTPLPRSVYVLAVVASALAVAADAGAEDRRGGPSAIVFALALAALGIAALGLSLALYASYSPVGHPVVLGLQGRYFIPPLLLCAPFLPRLLPFVRGSGVAVTSGFLAFALAVAVLVPFALVGRFAVAVE